MLPNMMRNDQDQNNLKEHYSQPFFIIAPIVLAKIIGKQKKNPKTRG
jgi:hypothetical protein